MRADFRFLRGELRGVSGFYVHAPDGALLGFVHRTDGSHWCATHKENYGKTSVPGFVTRQFAAEFMYEYKRPERYFPFGRS